MVAVAVLSMVLGGSWWRDDPIQLIPALSLAVAALPAGGRRGPGDARAGRLLLRGVSRDVAEEATCAPGPGWSMIPAVGQLHGQVEPQT